jgi:hypothetical protein
MPETVFRDIASWCRLYLAAKPSHMGEQCGWASLPSALSYGLLSSGEGIEFSARCCLVVTPTFHKNKILST